MPPITTKMVDRTIEYIEQDMYKKTIKAQKSNQDNKRKTGSNINLNSIELGLKKRHTVNIEDLFDAGVDLLKPKK
jgi:hypothetical protein